MNSKHNRNTDELLDALFPSAKNESMVIKPNTDLYKVDRITGKVVEFGWVIGCTGSWVLVGTGEGFPIVARRTHEPGVVVTEESDINTQPALYTLNAANIIAQYLGNSY